MVLLHENPGPAQVKNRWTRTVVNGGLDVQKVEDARFADFDEDGRIDAVVTATEKRSEKVGIHWSPWESGSAFAASSTSWL